MNPIYILLALRGFWRLTFSKNPEDVQAQHDLEEHGKAISEHPAEYVGEVGFNIGKVIIFLAIIGIILWVSNEMFNQWMFR
jgi:hypothetical protein